MAGSANYLLRFGADAGSVTKAITGINRDVSSLNSQASKLKTAFNLTGDTSVLQKRLTVLNQALYGTQKKSRLLKQELAEMKAAPGFDANSVKAQSLTRSIGKTDAEAEKLKAQISNVKAGGLDSAANSAGKLKTHIGAGAVAMGTFVGNLAGNLVGKAFSLIKDNAGAAVDRIDTLANSTRNFTNMGVKTSVVNKEMKNLQSAIQGLPTPLDSAVSGVQLLTSSMNGDMAGSVEVFKALNDGILGFGGTSEQVTNTITQLSQAFSNGKIDAETWNSMIDSGLGPTLNSLAKTMGMTTGELKAGLSDGTVSVEEFNKGLVNLDKNGGGGIKSLAQIAADGTKGISTSFANAKTAVVRGVGEMITQANNGIKGLDITTPLGKISGIGDIISQAGAVAEGALGSLAGMIAPTIGAIGTAFQGLVTSMAGMNFSNVTAALSQIKLPPIDITPLTNLATSVVPMLSSAFASLRFDGLVNLANAIIPAVMAGFQTFLGWVVPAIQPLLNAFVNLWNAIQPVATIIASVLTPAFQVLGSFLGGFVGGVMGTLTFAFNAAAIAIRALTPVVSMVAGVFRSLSPVISMIAGILGTVLGASVNLIGATFSRVGAAIGRAWQSMSGVVRGASNTVRSIIQAVGNVIRTVANVFRSSGSSMGGAIRGAASVIRGAGSSIMGVARNIIGSFRGIGGRIASGFSGVLGKIGSHFSGAVSKIGSYFSGVSSIGRNIVNGIVSGVTGAAGSLYSALSNLAGNALSAAKKKLGIHSPSRVFRDEVGRYITQGIGVGMEKESLSSSAEGVKKRLLNDFSGTQLNSNLANGVVSSPQGASATSNSSMVFNISANTKSDASSIANEVKLVLRQNGIKAR